MPPNGTWHSRWRWCSAKRIFAGHPPRKCRSCGSWRFFDIENGSNSNPLHNELIRQNWNYLIWVKYVQLIKLTGMIFYTRVRTRNGLRKVSCTDAREFFRIFHLSAQQNRSFTQIPIPCFGQIFFLVKVTMTRTFIHKNNHPTSIWPPFLCKDNLTLAGSWVWPWLQNIRFEWFLGCSEEHAQNLTLNTFICFPEEKHGLTISILLARAWGSNWLSRPFEWFHPFNQTDICYRLLYRSYKHHDVQKWILGSGI